MNHPMQPIIQHLFQASSLEDVSRQRLESFVEEYPSFGIGHYLLSRKLRTEGDGNYREETQKTNLYFTNPFWLQWLLENSEATRETIAGPVQEQIAASTTEAGPAVAAEASYSVQSEGAVAAHGDEPVAAHLQEPDEALLQEPVAAQLQEPVAAGHHVWNEEPVSSVAASDDELDRAAEPNAVTLAESWLHENGEREAPAPTEAFHMTGPSAAELLLESIEEAKGLRENLQRMSDDYAAAVSPEAAAVSHAGAVSPEAMEFSHPAADSLTAAAAQETPIHDEEAPFILPEAEEPATVVGKDVTSAEEIGVPAAEIEVPGAAAEVAAAANEVPVAAIEASVAATTDAPAASETPAVAGLSPAAAEQPVIPPAQPVISEQSFIFEPYHTIDYFASQGIKLTLDENPSDQLGKQMKSFTEWLKIMRRLPQKERVIVQDRVAEQTVQTIAAHSIESKEVVTETMAEVLAKQGMPQRARAVYEKLSLLNPGKSAYFATKIEQLNIH